MKYRAITGENFYLLELKNTCKFLLSDDISPNISEEEFKKKLKENDILDSKTESNFLKKFQSIKKRYKVLTENLKKELIIANAETSKFINLYAILCCERIMAEFMDEVIREKYSTFDYEIKYSDFVSFINYKATQSEIINAWTEAGKKKMVDKLKNFLKDGGFLEKIDDSKYKIIKPIIDPKVIDEIEVNGNNKILRTMLY